MKYAAEMGLGAIMYVTYCYALLRNGSVNTFPQTQILGKQLVAG
jgi:hypothetical protein